MGGLTSDGFNFFARQGFEPFMNTPIELGAEVGFCCKSGVLTTDIMSLESNIRVNV